ncbi:DUF5630 domain-containing protein [Legionella lytica]|uniref:DUF5630 domain-containing protein n=1 Tax=Legionella lytica TaxID=96232 RepID=A0ABW8D6H9_9GAMM
MFFPKNVNTLKEHMALNAIENTFLTDFLALEVEEKIKSVQNLIEHNQFDFIVKLSWNSKEFSKTCLEAEFQYSWESLWSTFGTILTGDAQVAFYVQPHQKAFNLFLGAYFYNQSLAFKDRKTPSIEKGYLLEAIKYGSIHALQRYCFSVYEGLDNEQDDPEAASKIHALIITIKKFLPFYTSYACLMLSEAYARYAMFQPEQASQATQSALNACEKARELYNKEDPAVFNASLGRGLSASNTLGCATPEEAAAAIKNQLFRDEPAFTSRFSNW